MFKQDRSEQVYMGAMAGIVVVSLIVGFLCAWLVMPSHKGAVSCNEWAKVSERVRPASSIWWSVDQKTGIASNRVENGELVETYTQTCEKRSPMHIQEESTNATK